jgi:SseB protein N-terminal domain
VAHKLASSEIILPTEGVYENGGPLLLRVASDNQGREWVYAYTDEPELLAAFPDGCPFVAMQFRDVFKIVERDARFGGIFINPTDNYKYPIPREAFDHVHAALAAAGGNRSSAKK